MPDRLSLPRARLRGVELVGRPRLAARLSVRDASRCHDLATTRRHCRREGSGNGADHQITGRRAWPHFRSGLGIQAVLTALAALMLLAAPGVPSPPLYVSLAGFAMAGILLASANLSAYLKVFVSVYGIGYLAARRRQDARPRWACCRRRWPRCCRRPSRPPAPWCSAASSSAISHLEPIRAITTDRRPLLRQPRQADQGDRPVPLVRQHRGQGRPRPRRAVDLRQLRRRGAAPCGSTSVTATSSTPCRNTTPTRSGTSSLWVFVPLATV